ncbi:DUF1682 family protein [Schizosaccharomyces japonicus yFS275]|uniref:DUF1682 family protein n=1 Tax=Schizosaccharomyces japonicus (strain yFS275 / FY16936) TaxID=402676 RepID=B6K5F5_SCHJY|nr:DUF1682 family protein [Schizosaccharomyces japonicus yFS275]EEB08759.1 DUF1682 family protein [Schizosaccharomyces japonicus yFS275]
MKLLVIFGLFVKAFAEEIDVDDFADDDAHPVVAAAKGSLWRNLRPQDFKLDLVVVGLIAFYFVCYVLGKKKNEKLAQRWYESVQSFFRSQFAQYGSDNSSSPVMKFSAAEFRSYLTGRLNVKYVHTTLTLAPRQDRLSQWLSSAIDLVMGNLMAPVLPPRDHFEIMLTFPDKLNWEPFVFAIVRKDCMRTLRETRYDLGFTRISESPLLPKTHVVMSENAEITQNILGNERFLEAVKRSLDTLEFLIVTDQPSIPPADTKDITCVPRVDASISIPNISAVRSISNESAEAMVAASLAIADMASSSFQWRPEVTKKLVQARKTAAEDVAKYAAAQQAKSKKKSPASAKSSGSDVSNLSAEEQKKLLDRERQRRNRRRAKRV